MDIACYPNPISSMKSVAGLIFGSCNRLTFIILILQLEYHPFLQVLFLHLLEEEIVSCDEAIWLHLNKLSRSLSARH